jgi:hypothetical protein
VAEAARPAVARWPLTGVLPLLLGACVAAGQPEAGAARLPLTEESARCMLAPEDAAWLSSALARWQQAERDWLELPPALLPTIETADGVCTYRLPQGDFSRLQAEPHAGTLHLAGRDLPLGPVSFADGPDRFVMTLPSLWRAAGVDSEAGLERLMTGVLLHEIMHTRQASIAAQAIGAMEQASGLGDELTDDSVQAAFAGDPAYVAAYQAERDLLFAAAAEPDDDSARDMARRALAMMRDRRARWFTGDKAWMSEADDVFLTMEGAGQWLVWRDMSAADGAGLAPAAALAATRRGGRWWTQDEGLALMLALERLLPGWQRHAFREPDWRAANLLARATAGE